MSTTTPDTNPELFNPQHVDAALSIVMSEATHTLDHLDAGDDASAEHHATNVREVIEALTPIEQAALTINVAYLAIRSARAAGKRMRPRRSWRRRFSV